MTPSNHQFVFKRSSPCKHLIWLIIGCGLLFIFGCTIAAGEKVPSQTTMIPKPSSTLTVVTIAVTSTSTYTPTFTLNPTLESTQVIVFHPEGIPTPERTGSCWSSSDVLNRADAWRCTSGDDIYDPCFSIPGNSQAVICDTSPLSNSTGFKLNLIEPLPSHWTITTNSALAFELADGTNCSFVGGATAAFGGKRVNYSCSDGWWILGELQKGQVWTAQKIRQSSDFSSIVESVQVSIRIVWF